MMERCRVLIVIAILLLICPKAVISQNCGFRRFVLAEDSDQFPPENTRTAASDVSICAGSCYRNRRCIAVGFDQSSQQCYMFNSYMIQTTGGTRLSGALYLTLESTCGPDESPLPREHWRDDAIVTSLATCDFETKTFVGTNDTSVCIYPSLTWTSASGVCVDDEIPFRMNGRFLQPINAKMTIVGSLFGSRSTFYLRDAIHNYLLKLEIDLDSNIVIRNSRLGGFWQGDWGDLDGPFPFVGNKTFTMDIVSSAAEFKCTVDGQLLFTFTHRLPRESISSIAIFGSIKLLKILTT